MTGTNAKPTVEIPARSALAGERAASIGTLGVTTPDESVSTGLTTPDIVTFLGNLSGLAREGVTHVAFEASSHGLTQYRNEGVRAAAVAFTNLSRDHLDYHAGMEDYFAAKMRLFDEVAADGGSAVVWMGLDRDEWARRAVETCPRRGLRCYRGRSGETIRLAKREPTQLGLVLCHRNYSGETRNDRAAADRRLSAANALVALGWRWQPAPPRRRYGSDLRPCSRPVRGRLERPCYHRTVAPIYVDTRNTPDAIHAAIAPWLEGPHVRVAVITVAWRMEGQRDSRQALRRMGPSRPPRNRLVSYHRHNPRGEDAAHIRAEVRGAGGYARENRDRREAIFAAIAELPTETSCSRGQGT